MIGKFARRAVVEATLTKIVGELVVGLGSTIQAAGKTIECAGDAFFLFEADAARRYKAATGYDLGAACGYPERYEEKGDFVTYGAGEDDDEDED